MSETLAEQCLEELMVIMWYRGTLPEEGKALRILQKYIDETCDHAHIDIAKRICLDCGEYRGQLYKGVNDGIPKLHNDWLHLGGYFWICVIGKRRFVENRRWLMEAP